MSKESAIGESMKLLVTAGNTQTPIDRVRCITNIFSGRTGAAIAVAAHDRGHDVTLCTSHPEVIEAIPANRSRSATDWRVEKYRTFEDLESLLARLMNLLQSVFSNLGRKAHFWAIESSRIIFVFR